MKQKLLKIFFLALSVISGGWLAWYGAVMWMISRTTASSAILTQSEAKSLDIIGGADGPTAVFVTYTRNPDWDLILVGAMLVAGLVGLWCMRKKRK